MVDFGKRLKEERERIGLSQAKFAEVCGVGKTAQYMYEKGEREPSLSYFEAARAEGIDILYLITSERSGNDFAYYRASTRLLLEMENLLGLKENEIAHLCYQRVELEEAEIIADRLGQDRPSLLPWRENITKWLETARFPDACIDLELFSRIVSQIESVTERNSLIISPDKKTKAAVTLYRSFKANGKIDQKLIEDMIHLSAS